jgi:hypothetical protein
VAGFDPARPGWFYPAADSGNNSINGYDYLGNSWFSKYIIKPIQKLLGKVNTAVAKSGVNVDGVGVQTSIPITPANPNGQTPRTGPDPFGGTVTGTGGTPGVIVVGTGSAPQSPGGTTNTQPSGGNPNVFTVPNVTTPSTPSAPSLPALPTSSVGDFRDLIAITLDQMDSVSGGRYHFNSNNAVNQLLGTALIESGGLQFRDQLGGGPGSGIYQIEEATYNDIMNRYIPSNQPGMMDMLRHLFTPAGGDLSYGQVRNDDGFATAIARIKYWMRSGDIPSSVADQAAYWRSRYNGNSPNGLTPADYIRIWNQNTGGQYDPPPPPPPPSNPVNPVGGGRGNVQEN